MARQHLPFQCLFPQGFQAFASFGAHTGSLLGYCHGRNPRTRCEGYVAALP
ncbi:hypothetical protein GLE_0264 [Lysobacter enzymogenes]|uniref:Uncharacterized protein n=1 Tax=Lysobacter enzymogenes TaxID=69 RepID=A0A0S2DAQ7_LYSEN|nr:hypothetical protein GLE_0264 [Lysobacter enzymogenes]